MWATGRRGFWFHGRLSGMSSLNNNPTPLNVPSPQDANGTLTPKAGVAASTATAPAAVVVPVDVAAAPSLPSTSNATQPPGVPIAVGAAPTTPTVATQVPPLPAGADLNSK